MIIPIGNDNIVVPVNGPINDPTITPPVDSTEDKITPPVTPPADPTDSTPPADPNNPPTPPKDVETEVIEIEGLDYVIDADGNATLNGAIAYTAEQLAEMEEVPDQSLIEQLITTSGIKTFDDDGNDIVYTDDEVGRKQYIEDVYREGSIAGAEDVIKARYDKYPILKTVENYIVANGSLEGFNTERPAVVEITSETPESVMISTIRAARALKGDSEAEITKFIKWTTADNDLEDVAKSSSAYLKTIQDEEDREIENNAREVERQRNERNANYVNSIAEIVTKGTLNLNGKALNIPKVLTIRTDTGVKTVDRTALIEYTSKVGKYKLANGKVVTSTQFQIDKLNRDSNRTVENDVFDAISLLTKTDNSQLIQSAINSNKSDVIKKRLVKKVNVNSTVPPTNKKFKKPIMTFGNQ